MYRVHYDTVQGSSYIKYIMIQGSLEDICNKELWCADVSGMCLPTEQLALDGSECGRDKVNCS